MSWKLNPLRHEKISYVALQLVSRTIMALFKVRYQHCWQLCRTTHSVCTHTTTGDKGNTGKKEITGGSYRENLTFEVTAASQSESCNSHSKKWWQFIQSAQFNESLILSDVTHRSLHLKQCFSNDGTLIPLGTLTVAWWYGKKFRNYFFVIKY